jgi:hypothetical protein
MDTTTDLAVIRESPALFAWGAIHAIHDIGRYTFIAYQERLPSNATLGRVSRILFSVYVDGKTTSTSTGSLESAMLCAIAYGKLEVNHARWMHVAALKLMELEE